MMNGFLLVDKPTGITSFGVVGRVRYMLTQIDGKKHKVGHGGTLDPAATGLLVLAIGKNTKLLEQFISGDKSYDAEVKLGEVSTTDDIEGEITKISDRKPSERDVQKAINEFEGEIMQTPPIFSALKVNGRRAYDLARQGKPVELKPRQVNVKKIELLSYDYPVLNFSCDVTKGTYIRSLARGIGEELKTGAYLTGLRRTKLAEFNVNKAMKLEYLTKENIEQHFL